MKKYRYSNNKIFIGIISIILVLVITLGVSVSFFSYKKEGVLENSIKLGSITFKYTEMDNIGNGITITDAFPISDNEGKKLDTEGSYFDFKVESTLSRSDLEYEIVAYPTKDSTLPLDAIKFYLTERVNGEEKEINTTLNENNEVKTLNEYSDTLIKDKEGKTIYQETILKNTKNYIKKFRARMWISEDIDWSDDKYIGKSGSIRVDVYANSDMSMADGSVTTSTDTKIERVVANNKYLFSEVENKDYQYTLTVPYEVDKLDIDVITNNIDANVEIVLITKSLNLQPKENYFKAIVTSSDKSKKEEYILQVIREVDTDNTLFSLRVDGYSLSPTFNSEITEYELTLEANSIEIFATANSSVASIGGIGLKKLNWGENIFNIVVTSQEGLIRTYKIKVNNIQPTVPILTGGNENWVSESQTIKLLTDGSAISGVSKYEYYISNNNANPNDSTIISGTTLNELTISDEGTTYVWYRTVSNNGYKSNWSNYQVVKLDMTKPTISNIVNDSNSNWVNHNIIVTFDVNDTGGSGIAKTVYSYNKNNELADFDTVPTATNVKGTWFAERNQEVFVRTYDTAGNISDWYSIGYIRIDNTVPTVTINSNLPSSITKGDNYTILESYTVNNQLSGGSVSCSSNLDGIVTNTSQLTTLGNHTITCTVTTGAGNKATATKTIKVTYTPYTATNLITNGNFDDTSNWQKVHATNFEVSNGIATITSPLDTWQGLIGSDIKIIDDINNTHKFYMAINAKVPSNAFSYGIGILPYGENTYIAPAIQPLNNQYTKSSHIFTPSDIIATPSGYFGIYRNNIELSTAETIYIDYVAIIDLTETFDAGNEPDKEWCDKHINYFDGTTTIYK